MALVLIAPIIALWILLFLLIVISPFLPNVDTPSVPVPRELVRRSVVPPPANLRDEAA